MTSFMQLRWMGSVNLRRARYAIPDGSPTRIPTRSFARLESYVSVAQGMSHSCYHRHFDSESAYQEGHVSFFETTIRYLGGMLGAYSLSGNPILLRKADQLGWKLLAQFDTLSGLPNPMLGLSDLGSSLAEIASCQLEFKLLAHLTGRSEYYAAADRVMDRLHQLQSKTYGFWKIGWSIAKGIPISGKYSIGGSADSAYEYLLKQYLLTGKTERRMLDMYRLAMNGTIEHLLYLTPTRDMLYVTDAYGDGPSRRFEHLSCFLPGLLVLGLPELPLGSEREMHIWAADGLAHSCWTMYEDQPTGLGPDEVLVDPWPRSEQKYGSDKGRWVDVVNWWRANGAKGMPPGVSPPKPYVKSRTSRRDYFPMRPNYLLRPEVCSDLCHVSRMITDLTDRRWRVYT